MKSVSLLDLVTDHVKRVHGIPPGMGFYFRSVRAVFVQFPG